jgi:hypothetical protein
VYRRSDYSKRLHVAKALRQDESINKYHILRKELIKMMGISEWSQNDPSGLISNAGSGLSAGVPDICNGLELPKPRRQVSITGTGGFICI